MITVRDYPYGTSVVVALDVPHEDEVVRLKRRAGSLVVLRCDGDTYVRFEKGGLAFPLRYVSKVTHGLGFGELYISNPASSGVCELLVGKVGIDVESRGYASVIVSREFREITPAMFATGVARHKFVVSSGFSYDLGRLVGLKVLYADLFATLNCKLKIGGGEVGVRKGMTLFLGNVPVTVLGYGDGLIELEVYRGV